MKILVTGGAGFIGSAIVNLLVKNNHSVVIVDNLSSGRQKNVDLKAKFYLEEISNFEGIAEIFQKEKPEIVYHLAAQINVRKSVEDPIGDATTNIIGTLNLLNLCVKHGVKHFIFSSTGGALYGDTKDIPTRENHEQRPLSPYGCAKLSIEKYLHYFNKVHNLKYTVLRYSNVFGPRQNSEGEAGVVSIFLEKMFNNQAPKIFGGIQTRDFVFVGDVARANLLALTDEGSNTYNVCTGVETDIITVFEKLNKYFKNKFEPEYGEMKKGEPLRSCLSYEKIKSALGWEPLISFDVGLDRTYCWFLKHN